MEAQPQRTQTWDGYRKRFTPLTRTIDPPLPRLRPSRADDLYDLHDLYDLAGVAGRESYNSLHDLWLVPGLDLYYTDPARNLITVG